MAFDNTCTFIQDKYVILIQISFYTLSLNIFTEMKWADCLSRDLKNLELRWENLIILNKNIINKLNKILPHK